MNAAPTRFTRARPVATATAAFATLCATTTVIPLFDSARWIPPVLVAIALVALLGALSRAIGLPAALQPLLQLEGLLIWLTLLFARPEAALGIIPGPVALGTLQDLARAAVAEADTALAPVPTTPTLTLIAVGGIGFIAIIIDTVGVTIRLPGFAGIPLLLVCALPMAVIPGGLPLWYLAIAAVGWLALIAIDVRFDTRAWGPPLVARPLIDRPIPPTQRRTAGSMRPALVAGVLALAAALALPLLAPGLAEPVYVSSPGAGGPGAGGVTVDPFASLRRYLLEIPDAEVLRYTTDGEARPYLRLVALDTFDGATWVASQPAAPLPASESLGPPDAPSVADVRETTIDIAITGLQNEQLPVPYAAGQVQGINAPLDPRWQWNTSARTIEAAGLSSQGIDYRVTAYQVMPSRAELRTAPGYVDSAMADLLVLPRSITPDLSRLAREVTFDAATPYAKAVDLVRWFTRDGGFSYSTTVTTPEGADPLQSFLDQRVGYCQQFAATMALMARTLGIPSRVVIGFTGGRLEDGEHVVYARNAHAWPELWFEGIGWVWFEPTPRSDAAGGVAQPDYTEPRNDAETQGPTTAPSAADSADRRLPPEERAGGSPPTANSTPVDNRWALVMLVVLALLVCLPSVVVILRRRRRTSSLMTTDRVEGAWADLADSVRDLGWSWPLAATPRNAARILAAQVRLDADDLAVLTRLVTAVERARYAPPAPDAASPTGQSLRSDIARIRRTARKATGWRRRVRARIWPASLSAPRAQLTLKDVEDDRLGV